MLGCIYFFQVISSMVMLAITVIAGFFYWPVWILSLVIVILWPKEPKQQ